jgi:hypothetical protein
VEDNWIEDFDFAGLDFEQVVDVQVSCNAVASSMRGLSFSRDSEAYGSGVRFWQNSFLQNVDGDVATVETDASYKVKMGPESSGDKGKNVFKVWNEDTSYFLDYDASSDVLDATTNWWYLKDGSGETWLDDLTMDEHPEIDVRCRDASLADSSADAIVNVLSHKRTTTGFPTCPSSAPGARVLGPSVAGAGADPPALVDGPVRLHGAIPTETRLDRPFPNPTNGALTIPFSLAGRHAGRVTVEVFDVRGRRVRRLTNGALSPARYQLQWSGLDGAGERIAPGIYFVRLTAPGHVETAKVTVLR